MDSNKISLASLFAIALATAGCQLAFALDATGENIEEAVRKAQVIKKDYPVHAVISGREATILTRRHPKATDDDLRIDSVLITKSVLDRFDSIGTVQVLFRDEDSSSGKSVEVTAGDIKTYANGSIDPKKFLATIAVTTVGGDEEAAKNKLSAEERKFSVSPGPYEDQRLLLMDRINSLRRKGTGVAPFEAMFAQLEAQAKSGHSAAVKESLHKLGEKLAQQEDLVRQASRTGSGRGIKVVSSSKTSSQASQSSSQASGQSSNRSSDRVAAANSSAACDPIDEQNQVLIAKIMSFLQQHRGEASFRVYYLRKVGDIAAMKERGAEPARIKSMLASLVEELQRQKDERSNYKGGGGPAIGPGQQWLNQGYPHGGGPN